MDNKKKITPLDRELIDLKEPQEVDYWTDKFDITRAKLRAAVNAAGNLAKDVEAYLKKKQC